MQAQQIKPEPLIEKVQPAPVEDTPQVIPESPTVSKSRCRDIYIDDMSFGVLKVDSDNQPVQPRLTKLYRCDDEKCIPWFEAEGLALNCKDSAYFMHPDCWGKGDIACEFHPEIFACNPGLICEESEK